VFDVNPQIAHAHVPGICVCRVKVSGTWLRERQGIRSTHDRLESDRERGVVLVEPQLDGDLVLGAVSFWQLQLRQPAKARRRRVDFAVGVGGKQAQALSIGDCRHGRARR
jgi:hypothetical protein